MSFFSTYFESSVSEIYIYVFMLLGPQTNVLTFAVPNRKQQGRVNIELLAQLGVN